MNVKSTKLIATYSRVSTSAQEEQQTIKTQQAALKEFIKDNDYTVVREYVDDGWSGDILARPGLDQLRQDVKSKIWESVLIYDPDRLARRYSYQELVMDELRDAGIEIIFVTTPAPKDYQEKILHGVKGLFAEYERAKISERFRLGKVRKAKEGHLLVSEPLYGYYYIRKQEKRHGYYKINSEEERVVKMIFSWVADEGITLRKVVRKLQELGIKPRKSKRGVWSTSTLTTMLRNKAYIGEARWGSSYAVVPENPLKTEKYRKLKKTSRKIRPEEEWIASKIPVPAIIEKKLFKRARAQLEKNFQLCQRNRKNEYLLAGKIYCVCGNRRCGEGPQHGKHLYYRCNNRALNFPLPRTCNERGINARIVDQMVWQRLAGLMSSPEELLKQSDRCSANQRSEIKSSVGDIGAMEKEIAKLKIEEDRYNKAYGAGLFSLERLKEYTVPVAEKIKSLKSQISEAKQAESQTAISEMPTRDEVVQEAKGFMWLLSNGSLNFNLKRGIIIDVINRVIGTQEMLKVSGEVPITQNYVSFYSIHRNSWTSKCW